MNISNENTVTLIAVIIAIIIGIFPTNIFQITINSDGSTIYFIGYLCRLYRLLDCFVL